MKRGILSAHGSFPTCNNIRNAIEEMTGTHYPIFFESTKVNVVFRYGNSTAVSGEDTVFNSPQFIELSRSKLTFSEFCQANNLFSPVYHRITENPQTFPVLVRRTLTGMMGRGIRVVHNMEEFSREMRSDYFWTPFVNCAYELRVHLFGTRIGRLFKKIKNGTETNPTPIRNAENDYHFQDRAEEIGNGSYTQLIPLMEQLGSLLIPIGGNFSAVDVGWARNEHRYFIFEVNSAPGLNSHTVQEYANYLVESLHLGNS